MSSGSRMYKKVVTVPPGRVKPLRNYHVEINTQRIFAEQGGQRNKKKKKVFLVGLSPSQYQQIHERFGWQTKDTSPEETLRTRGNFPTLNKEIQDEIQL